MNVASVFEIERLDETAVLNLRRGLQDVEFDQPPPAAHEILLLLQSSPIKNIVVDCHEIDFLRSTALGFFVTLWKRARSKGGKVVFCNLSPKAREILRATKMDRVWIIRETRSEAFKEIDA